MDIIFYGQSFFKLKGKNATLLIDPFDSELLGLKFPKPGDLEADAVLITHNHPDHNFTKNLPDDMLKIEGPGEYEIKGVSVNGVAVFHDSASGAQRGKNTAYNIRIDGLNIVHLGDLGHVLTEDQSQEIGQVDILLLPVGGKFTIDAKAAAEVVSVLEPKIIIPMHYFLPGLKFELGNVEDFLKEMGAENVTPSPRLSITRDKLPEEPQVVILSKS